LFKKRVSRKSRDNVAVFEATLIPNISLTPKNTVFRGRYDKISLTLWLKIPTTEVSLSQHFKVKRPTDPETAE
jgi:hypothetical protein